jgi:hypothetical protein
LSFTGKPKNHQTTRLATVLERLMAAEVNSYPKESLLLSLVQIYIKLKGLQYPSKLVFDACMKKFHITKDLCWKLFATLISVENHLNMFVEIIIKYEQISL